MAAAAVLGYVNRLLHHQRPFVGSSTVRWWLATNIPDQAGPFWLMYFY
jgi:hypothetical protein